MNIQPPHPSSARFLRVRRTGTSAVVALTCAALLGACGSSSSTSSGGAKTVLNTVRVSRSIEESVLKERKLHATVVCPAGVPQEAGRTFECQAVTRAAKAPHTTTTTPFLVTVQNAHGYVTYVGGKPH